MFVLIAVNSALKSVSKASLNNSISSFGIPGGGAGLDSCFLGGSAGCFFVDEGTEKFLGGAAADFFGPEAIDDGVTFFGSSGAAFGGSGFAGSSEAFSSAGFLL